MNADWQPLGDQALLATCSDEAAASRLAHAIRHHPAPWLVDVVQAYTSVAIYLDLRLTDPIQAKTQLASIRGNEQIVAEHRLHRIPVCYERGLDLDRVASHAGLDVDRIINLYVTTVYTVYAIGFCQGFPYLGYLPTELQGVPRLSSPRLKVEAGSVGLTGKQTGIYTEARPGGWNIIGRTPLELVNVADGYFPLRTGDRVRFERIDEREYDVLEGQRLEVRSQAPG